MPSRTRTAKLTKALKENIGISAKPKLKSVDKVTKPPRKVLGDKTNSASDDNASIDIPNKAAKTTITDVKVTKLLQSNDEAVRPRRDRRIPSRFVENQILKNKENVPTAINTNNNKVVKKNNVLESKTTSNDTHSSIKNDSTDVSPFKTPLKPTEVSFVANRPRRVSRLPSRFEDHSISPSKFIPVQPCHASTPLAPKNSKRHDTIKTTEKINDKVNKNTSDVKKVKSLSSKDKAVDKNTNKMASDMKTTVKINDKVNKNTSNVEKVKLLSRKDKAVDKNTNKIASDNNNNAKGRTLRGRKAVIVNEKASKRSHVKTNDTKKEKSPATAKKITSKTKHSPVKLSSPLKRSYLNIEQTIKSSVKPSSPVKKPKLRTLNKDLSFKVLEEKKKNESNQDIYEFTFDPNEEPAPQKKKRKATKRKPAEPKPKTVTFKNNYDQNINKALAALKNAVTKKAPQTNDVAKTQKPIGVKADKNAIASNDVTNDIEVRTAPQVQRNVASKIMIGNTKQTTTNNVKNIPQIQQNIVINANQVHTNVPLTADPTPKPNQSIRVEDIAADFEFSPQHDIDYSPVNSPSRPKTPVSQISRISEIHHQDDPLNLRENISMEPHPIASSSMNTSVRYPQPSPWRVEFEDLPIRWHVNSYVKPNMTPAVECSFVNFDDKNKKKHVYTNIVPQHNEDLPEILQNDQPNLVQSSMFSFIKEIVDKSSSKKKRGRSVTPVTSSLFSDTTNPASKNDEKVKKSTRQLFTPKKNNDNATSDTSNLDGWKDDKENSKDSSRGQKRKSIEEAMSATPAKTPRKEKDNKYFGFDDSENLENVSPQKEIGRKKSLRQARARAVLKEINAQPAPTRAVIPVAVKTARMAEVERLYDEMNSASDAPIVSAKEPTTARAYNLEPIEDLDDETQTSVHLFEDVEDLVHHVKPDRKSYGKAKKVTFMRKGSSDTQDSDLRPDPDCDEEEDLHDLTFDPGLPWLDEDKKRTKKKPSRRQKMTKKEEEEADAWAAGFNSMCEDVEEFPLVVE